jgi:hypothetical protein
MSSACTSYLDSDDANWHFLMSRSKPGLVSIPSLKPGDSSLKKAHIALIFSSIGTVGDLILKFYPSHTKELKLHLANTQILPSTTNDSTRI